MLLHVDRIKKFDLTIFLVSCSKIKLCLNWISEIMVNLSVQKYGYRSLGDYKINKNVTK